MSGRLRRWQLIKMSVAWKILHVFFVLLCALLYFVSFWNFVIADEAANSETFNIIFGLNFSLILAWGYWLFIFSSISANPKFSGSEELKYGVLFDKLTMSLTQPWVKHICMPASATDHLFMFIYPLLLVHRTKGVLLFNYCWLDRLKLLGWGHFRLFWMN